MQEVGSGNGAVAARNIVLTIGITVFCRLLNIIIYVLWLRGRAVFFVTCGRANPNFRGVVENLE